LKSLELGIESDLGNVNLVAVATNRVCRELGLDESRAGQIELCVAEATTNAIRHAYQGQPGHLVEVRLSASHEELQVEVIDSGTPMPLKHQQVLLEGSKPFDVQPADLRSLAEGGRGLQIIFELMDKVSYVSGEANNRLIMTKRLPANPALS
jgi:serine/threonine-protein kinase RsbW